jgi:pimeloyl-ACP methyl ester carboxylesterase
MGASLLSFRDVMEGRLGNIKMPLLLIWGKEDRLIPYDVALRLLRELPQARLITAEGCGHLVLWDCPNQTVPEMIAFLQ